MKVLTVNLSTASPAQIARGVCHEDPRHRSLVTLTDTLSSGLHVLYAHLVESYHVGVVRYVDVGQDHRASELQRRHDRTDANRTVRHLIPPVVLLSTRTLR